MTEDKLKAILEKFADYYENAHDVENESFKYALKQGHSFHYALCFAFMLWGICAERRRRNELFDLQA